MLSAQPKRKHTPLDPGGSPGHVRISRWMVIVLAVWLVLDVVPRAFPVAWLHILPEHVATRRPGKFYPFIPNLKIHYDPWVGETATTGNLPPEETRSPLDFSTYNLSFRLTP